MEQSKNHSEQNRNPGNKNKATEPDPETLGTTDPQEHMKGPISSLMQKTREGADNNDQQPKEAEKHEHKKRSSGGDFINK
ncbi:MAG TPA: hypothetical protein VMH27_20630 [Puia sp.]|nr:hypothetical protein [Puia sp.]